MALESLSIPWARRGVEFLFAAQPDALDELRGHIDLSDDPRLVYVEKARCGGTAREINRFFASRVEVLVVDDLELVGNAVRALFNVAENRRVVASVLLPGAVDPVSALELVHYAVRESEEGFAGTLAGGLKSATFLACVGGEPKTLFNTEPVWRRLERADFTAVRLLDPAEYAESDT